jgi:hypothetical protein
VTAPGTYVVNATKSGYEEGKTLIEAAEKSAEFTFSNLTIEPSSVGAGKAVNIRVNATNTGKDAGESNVELLVNNKSVDSRNVSLGPGESAAIEFSHTENQAGKYTIGIGGLNESYEVTKNAPFLSGTVTLGILAAAFVLLRKRRN